MRFLLALLLSFTSILLYADDSGDFPPPPSDSMPVSNYPATGTATGAPSSNTSTGGDTFGTLVQQQTSQAMQTFQNVNYQKLSSQADQSDFFSDTGSSANTPTNPDQPFTMFQGNP